MYCEVNSYILVLKYKKLEKKKIFRIMDGSNTYLFKILLVGDPNVGKTSIVHRYVHGNYTDKYKATIGVDFALKTLHISNSVVQNGTNTESQTVYLQLWDLAGQDRVKHLTRVYYEGAAGIFIVFDVTNPSSLKSIKSWRDSIKDVLRDNPIPIFVLANKCDLIKNTIPDANNNLLANLPNIHSEVMEYFNDGYFDAIYTTSAKINMGIEEATITMAKLLINRYQQNPNIEKLTLSFPKIKEKRNCSCTIL
jgi:small GTP-binding protein